MQCPKCGEGVEAGAVICPRCDFILDTSFLGDDILNVTTGKNKPVRVSSAGDAVVLGGLDEEVALFSESTGSFLTADTMDVDREIAPAALYVGKSVQELMKPEAVLKAADDVDKRKAMLSAFELHVLSFIDGQRPVARLRKKTGLSSDDVRIAVGMLAEKGAVVLAGHVEKPSLKDLLASDESTDPENTTEDAKLPGALAPTKRSGEWKPVFPLDDVRALEDESKGTSTSPFPDVEREPAPFARTATPSATLPRTPTPPPLPRTGTPGAMKRPAGVLPRQPSMLGVPEETRLMKERAAGFFDLAHVELNKGNRVRAHVYAKLAADTDPAEPKYAELLKSWPQKARAAATTEAALFADADMAEKQGNFHRALSLLEQALDVSPNAAHIHNRRGLMLATRFKRFSDASDALMKAVELEPNNVAYKNNLGKIIALAHDKGAPGVTTTKPGPQQAGGLLGKLKKAFE